MWRTIRSSRPDAGGGPTCSDPSGASRRAAAEPKARASLPFTDLDLPTLAGNCCLFIHTASHSWQKFRGRYRYTSRVTDLVMFHHVPPFLFDRCWLSTSDSLRRSKCQNTKSTRSSIPAADPSHGSIPAPSSSIPAASSGSQVQLQITQPHVQVQRRHGLPRRRAPRKCPRRARSAPRRARRELEWRSLRCETVRTNENSPKNQGPSKVKVLRVQTPAMQGPNPP